MDLELVKFINSDLTWNAVKKGHRSMKRRPKKSRANSSDSSAFDYEKSGVAILGQHFGDEVLDVPIKKRILMLTHHEESDKHASKIRSTKSNNGLTDIPQSKPIETKIPDLNDFSGIELLAAAACHSSVHDNVVVEEHTTLPLVESYTEDVKDDIAPAPIDSDDSSVQDDGKGEGDKNTVPSKDVRLHWDLNTVMDEWEEPCCDILVDPHSVKDDLQITEKNLESYETVNCEDNEQVKSVSEVVQGGCVSNDDKVNSEDRLSDCCGSNTVDKVKTGGYDSPVEDGELRDTWQKSEVEEMECVDYESDNIYEDNFDTVESVDQSAEIVPNNEAQLEDKTEVQNKSNQEYSQSAISEEKDFSSRKFVPERKIVNLNDSCIPRSRSDNFGDSYLRGKRDFGQEKSTGREGQSYHGWDSRNSQRYTSRPKHVIGGSRNSQPINYDPRGSNYKTYNTRLERSESYGVHRGNSRDRFKGFHPQGSRREEYNGHDTCHPDRKVSSLSSNYTRGPRLSRRRSRSRSRSRSESPIAWHFQKKRIVETKKEIPDYKRASPIRTFQENLGRLKSSDRFCPTSQSRRFPQANGPNRFEEKTNDEKYGGNFRYRDTRNRDDGFRYGRNENRYFKDPVGRVVPEGTSQEKGCRYMFTTHRDDSKRE